jgi:phosphoribosylformimino-5-aminoimidazole carboxamide ribotide isomerase
MIRHPPSYYAELYRRNDLTGGHVIKLGPKNDEAAKEACQTWPNGLQVGGGITLDNAQEWLDAGASKVGSSFPKYGKRES